jgi:transposase
MGIAEIKKEMKMDAPELREGERSETFQNGGASIPTMAPVAGIVDPEVESKARRRQYSAAYKQRILDEADNGGPGAVASLLRREGLYSSHLTAWRKQRESGELAGLEPRRRGKKPAPKNPLAREVHRLDLENRRLQKRLRQAEIIIDVQKKLCDVLGLTVPPIEQSEDDE